ncbi:hypothetical protein HOK51_07660 [Candidatus Woesearchaeota archaeon]|jgi:hypothetical protein|nr:hypothetical protein [Candidatus Woesearchaeota archaeon]MBT6519700.1 hypothetical protein [Candidatus Woesearchaeota archaeon]MBT7367391.1 hypothetical protein [Candidatus Woesearchaeota archaeon]
MNQTQTEQKLMQNNFALKKLQGIKPNGVKSRGKTNLEKLLATRDTVLKENRSNLDQVGNNASKSLFLTGYMFRALKNIEFNESDLRQFIFATAHYGYDDNTKLLAGVLPGCLLTILTKRRREKNKQTFFHVDGEGMEYPYLFYSTQLADYLVVENFKGDHICNNVAVGHDTFVNAVYCRNLEGKSNLSSIGMSGAKLNLAIGLDLRGDSTFFKPGYNSGSIGLIYSSGCEGERMFVNVGRSKGKIDMIIAHNESWRNYSLEFFGWGAEYVNLLDISGDLSCCFSETKNSKIKKYCPLQNVKILLDRTSDPQDYLAGASYLLKLSASENSKDYADTRNKFFINQIEDLVEDLRNQNEEQIFNTLKQVEELHAKAKLKQFVDLRYGR